jgi:hypothetical protein
LKGLNANELQGDDSNDGISADQTIDRQRSEERGVMRPCGYAGLRRHTERLVYICHAFRSDPRGNAERVRRICEQLKHDCVPLAPHLLLPGFIDEATERDLALRHCLQLVAAADEVRVFGAELTAGMQLEIAEAHRLGIPVIYVDRNGRRPLGARPGAAQEREGRNA